MAEVRARFYSTDGSGGISLIGQHDDWRRTWHAILPVSVGFNTFSCLFFYDRHTGEGKVFKTNGQGGITLLSQRKDLDPGWDIVKAGNFGEAGHQQLLFYNRILGKIRVYTIDAEGNLEPYRQELGWGKTWDTIVTGNFGGGPQSNLLLYDRTAGLGEFYTFDDKGNRTLFRRYTGWKKTWDIIVPGSFSGAITGHTDLLFYRRVVGEAKFFATSADASMSLVAQHTNWRKTWDVILPGFFGGDAFSDLVFYDRAAGRGRLASTDGSGNATTLKTYDGWRTTWGRIVVGSFSPTPTSDLLFYDNGLHVQLYAVRCMDDNGDRKAQISAAQIEAWRKKANATYGPAGVVLEFDSVKDFVPLKNTTINSLEKIGDDDPDEAVKEFAKQAATQWASNHPGKLVVFFRHGWSDDPGKPTGGGFSAGDSNFVAMPGFDVSQTTVFYQDGTSKEAQNLKLFAHEVAHYLGLPHTFVSIKYKDDDGEPLFDKPEDAVVDYLKKKGSTSPTTLDNDRAATSDTPPDVGTTFYDLKGWNRADFSKEITISSPADGIKMTFSPDRHNVSSYFNCDDYVRVSPDQARRMRDWLRQDHRKALVAGQV